MASGTAGGTNHGSSIWALDTNYAEIRKGGTSSKDVVPKKTEKKTKAVVRPLRIAGSAGYDECRYC